MTITVERDIDLMHVAGSGVAWATDKGVSPPAAPSDPAEMPVSPWLGLGAVTEEGLTTGYEETREGIRVWGLLSDFRTLVTSSLRTFRLQLRETQRDIAVSLMYKVAIADLARTSGIRSFSETSTPAPDRRAFLFKAVDGETVQQIYVPIGEVTERGDIQHQPSDSSLFELTISAYPDASGNTVYISDNAPETVPGGTS